MDKKYTRTLAATAVATAALIAATACSSGSSTTAAPAASTPPASSSAAAPATSAAAGDDASADVKLTKTGIEPDVTGERTYVVHYTVTNHSAAAADYQIQLTFYDKDGDQLGTTGTGPDALGPGKTSTGESTPLAVELPNGKIADIVSTKVTEVDRTPTAK